MEAALRTAYEAVTGKTLDRLEFKGVRGLEGIKEETIHMDGLDVHVAVAHSTGMASKLLDMIKRGEKQLHFIEVMGCPGGCVNGGGQPIVPADVRARVNPAQVRAAGLYGEDEAKSLRKSHENPEIKRLYDEFLGEPNSHKAHELLHTHYAAKPRY